MAKVPPSNGKPQRRIVDKAFIEEILSEPVKSFKTSPGSKPGDNVAGHLLSIFVETQSGNLHNILIKSVLPLTSSPIDPMALAMAELNADSTSFPVEVMYYRDIVPMFTKLANHFPDLGLFSRPKFYSGEYKKEEGIRAYLAMEDLRPSGYKMLDKFAGLNLNEMLGAITELAKFHAVSYVLLNGELGNKTFQEMFKDKDCLLNKHCWDFPGGDAAVLFNGLIKEMAEIVRKDDSEIADRIVTKFGASGFQNMMDLWNRTGKEDKFFPVLIHGDLWTNNVLFKLNGASVEDVKFIDFQIIRFGNIYEDLQYFVFTSCTPEFRRGNLKTCLKAYYSTFSKVLKTLGNCKMPKGFTEEELISVFEETRDYGAAFTFVTIPYQLGIQPETQKPDSNTEDNEATLDFNKLMEKEVAGLVKGTKNSAVALRWLREVVQEMVEFGNI